MVLIRILGASNSQGKYYCTPPVCRPKSGERSVPFEAKQSTAEQELNSIRFVKSWCLAVSLQLPSPTIHEACS